MKHLVVLLSGRGSNLRAIVSACEAEGWDARVAAVVSNRADAPGLAFARDRGIATRVVDHTAFPDRAAFDAALAEAIDAFAPDVVALAGFMRILTDAFVARYAGRLVNVHPSLLPAFPGLDTHRRALAAGCCFAGATVHFVTPTLDVGPVIAQAAVPVRADDTPASLAERVLQAEHVLYPRVLRWLLRGELATVDGRVRHRGGEAQALVCDDLRSGSPRC